MFEAALKTFRTDAPKGWSFTQTTVGDAQSRVERYNAAQPEFNRWTLLQQNGRQPTADEFQDYAEKLSFPVSQFMTKDPETLPPDAPMTFAINRMDVGGYRHVPVVQDDRIVGAVSALDVIRFVVRHAKESIATSGVTTSHGVDKHRSAAGARG